MVVSPFSLTVANSKFRADSFWYFKKKFSSNVPNIPNIELALPILAPGSDFLVFLVVL